MRRFAIDSAAAIALLTGTGVFLSGITDWLQGSAPDGLVALPDAVGLVLFLGATIGTVSCAIAAPHVEPSLATGLRVASISFAAAASAIGDPTYGALLFAIPLIDIGRRVDDRHRSWRIGGIFLLAGILVALESQRWSGNGLEATLVLSIALLITAMLGVTLGQLEAARRLESELARIEARDHLARELHDSVGHSLLASSIQLKNAAALWKRSPDSALRSVDLASRAVDEALIDTRIAVDTIRSEGPPFALDAALPGLLDRVSSSTLTTDLAFTGEAQRVNQLAQITLYRVAQEALTNIVRHSEATHADVQTTVSESKVTLVIADNGRGFDADTDVVHAGLQSLSERVTRIGGTLSIESAAGAGTTLTAVVELDR